MSQIVSLVWLVAAIVYLFVGICSSSGDISPDSRPNPLAHYATLSDEYLNHVKEFCSDGKFAIWKTEHLLKLAGTMNSEDKRVSMTLGDDCVFKNKEMLMELATLIQLNENDICSYHSISRISHFHWKYAIGKLDEKWSKSMDGSMDGPAIAFFLFYVDKVAKNCAAMMTDNLRLVDHKDSSIHGSVEWILQTPVAKAMEKFGLATYRSDHVKELGDFVLFWEAIVNKLKLKGKLPIDVVDSQADMAYGFLKMEDPSDLWELHDTCRYRLRPVYQATTLSVMRLIDMGFSYDIQGINIRDDPLTKNWYAVTQFCEFILGFAVYKDPTMKKGKILLLDHEDEAKNLVGETFKSRMSIPSNPDVWPIELAQRMIWDSREALDKMRKQIRKSIKARTKYQRTIFKNVFKYTLKHPIASLKSLYFVQRTKQRANNVVNAADPGSIDQVSQQADELMADDDGEGVRVRTKREDSYKTLSKHENFMQFMSKPLVFYPLIVLASLVLCVAMYGLVVLSMG